jgi:hypothetical protein
MSGAIWEPYFQVKMLFSLKSYCCDECGGRQDFPTVVMICWVDMVDTRGPRTNKQFAKFPVDMAYTAFCGPAKQPTHVPMFRLS